MRVHLFRQILGPALPYLAILIGLYALHHAWVAIILYHIGISVILIVNSLENLRRRIQSGMKPRVSAIAATLSVLSGVTIFHLWPYAARVQEELPGALASLRLGGTSWWIFMIYYATIHPILEEAYWRGYLASGRKRVALEDLEFAGYHALVLQFFIEPPWVLASIAALTIVAWIWRLTVIKYRGLGIAIVSHMAANLSIVIAVQLLILNTPL